jgi:hypothetical protein
MLSWRAWFCQYLEPSAINEEARQPNEWKKNFMFGLKNIRCCAGRTVDEIKEGGFIHSFNGPHSLFVDTIRSCRALILSHFLGHQLQAEGDQRISLLDRAVQHIRSTARYSIFYGGGRDEYDVWGRTAHESIFNTKDVNFRCPNSQQGYSGFTTWTGAWHGRCAVLQNNSNGLIQLVKKGLMDCQKRKIFCR